MSTNIKGNIKLTVCLAGLAAFAAYLPALRGEFVLSDAYLISQAGGSPFAGLSLLVDRSIWGTNPTGFHLTSALLHAANAMLAFAAGYLLFGKDSPLPALLAALIFAIHPANTEAVSWISARSELIYTMFCLLSFVSYLHYERRGGAAGLFLTGVFFFLSLLGSEKALAFAAVLPLYALIVSEHPAGYVRRLIPAVAVSALTLGFYYALKPLISNGELQLALKNPLFEMGISPGLGYYAETLLLPLDHALYPAVPENPFYTLAGLALMGAVVFLYYEKLRLEAFLAAWIVAALLPSFFSVDKSGAVLAERHLYFPAAAFSLLAASALFRVKSRPVLLLASIGLLAAYTASTAARAADWSSEESLLDDALRKNAYSMYEDPSQASYILTMLGVKEIEAGNYEKAKDYLLEAVRADERNYMAYYQSGRLFEMLHTKLGKAGDVEAQKALAREAAEVIERGQEHFPNYVYLNYNLGLWYMRNHRWDEAQGAFMTVLRLDPSDTTAAATVEFLRLIEEVRKRGLWGYNAADADKRPKKAFNKRSDLW